MVRLLSIALSAALFSSATAAGLREGARVVSAVTHFTAARGHLLRAGSVISVRTGGEDEIYEVYSTGAE